MSGRALRWLLSLGVRAPRPNEGSPRLTIVRQHRIYRAQEQPLYRLGVSEALFDAQVAACVATGLTPMTVQAGLDWLANAKSGHRLAFSFDDGYADNVTLAVPILVKHGAKGTFYLAAGLMDEQRAPWWDELAWCLTEAAHKPVSLSLGGQSVTLDLASWPGQRAALRALLPMLRVPPAEQRARLDALREGTGVRTAAPCALAPWSLAQRFAEAGMEVGAHTLTHPFLSLIPPAEQTREIVGSAAMIRERLRAPVTGLAYPNGDHDAHTIAATNRSGLAYAVTTLAGDCTHVRAPFEVPRRALTEGACLAPGARFSAHMLRAELTGAFDHLRRDRAEAGT